MPAIISDFSPAHYDQARALWSACEGIALSEADAPAAIAAFLKRNPGLSLVALENDRVIGTILCGQDGRRGYIHHLAVAPAKRRRGIGSQLVQQALERLRGIGIAKCHLFVFESNSAGKTFWAARGFAERDDIAIMSHNLKTTSDGPCGCC